MVVLHHEPVRAALVLRRCLDVVRGVNVDLPLEHASRRVGGELIHDQRIGCEMRCPAAAPQDRRTGNHVARVSWDAKYTDILTRDIVRKTDMFSALYDQRLAEAVHGTETLASRPSHDGDGGRRASAVAQDASFPVTLVVDAAKPQGAVKNVWRFSERTNPTTRR